MSGKPARATVETPEPHPRGAPRFMFQPDPPRSVHNFKMAENYNLAEDLCNFDDYYAWRQMSRRKTDDDDSMQGDGDGDGDGGGDPPPGPTGRAIQLPLTAFFNIKEVSGGSTTIPGLPIKREVTPFNVDGDIIFQWRHESTIDEDTMDVRDMLIFPYWRHENRDNVEDMTIYFKFENTLPDSKKIFNRLPSPKGSIDQNSPWDSVFQPLQVPNYQLPIKDICLFEVFWDPNGDLGHSGLPNMGGFVYNQFGGDFEVSTRRPGYHEVLLDLIHKDQPPGWHFLALGVRSREKFKPGWARFTDVIVPWNLDYAYYEKNTRSVAYPNGSPPHIFNLHDQIFKPEGTQWGRDFLLCQGDRDWVINRDKREGDTKIADADLAPQIEKFEPNFPHNLCITGKGRVVVRFQDNGSQAGSYVEVNAETRMNQVPVFYNQTTADTGRVLRLNFRTTDNFTGQFCWGNFIGLRKKSDADADGWGRIGYKEYDQ